MGVPEYDNYQRSRRTRALLTGDAAYDVNVTAGANGMTCLTFNGETIRVLLSSAPGQF